MLTNLVFELRSEGLTYKECHINSLSPTYDLYVAYMDKICHFESDGGNEMNLNQIGNLYEPCVWVGLACQLG